MTLEKLVEMFEGQPSDNHTLEVSLGDIREWHDEIERLQAVLRGFVDWNNRNGGYGELPPLVWAAEAALTPGRKTG